MFALMQRRYERRVILTGAHLTQLIKNEVCEHGLSDRTVSRIWEKLLEFHRTVNPEMEKVLRYENRPDWISEYVDAVLRSPRGVLPVMPLQGTYDPVEAEARLFKLYPIQIPDEQLILLKR